MAKTAIVADIEEQPMCAAAEVKYPIEKLQKNCKKLFGVSLCTFVGATAGMTGEFSVKDMKEAISKWQKSEVK